jgi:hypothetical protein
MTNLENDVNETLNKARETLGGAVPRLIFEKRQVAVSGLTHGLTGQYTHLSAGDLVLYAKTGAQYFKDSQPVGMREIQLLQCIIDTSWRLARVPLVSDDDSNELAKFARYTTTLTRQLITMSKEFDRMKLFRIQHTYVAGFKLAECEGYRQYNELLAIATRLVEARHELQKKSEIAKGRLETIGSDPVLVRKTILRVTQPLTKITHQSLQVAADWGLLTPLELTLTAQAS